MKHIPVLPKEVIELLNLTAGDNVIDGTVGQGGYVKKILEKTQPKGKVLGIDWDGSQIENAKTALDDVKDRVVLSQGSYVDMDTIAVSQHFENVQGIILDLGFSSWHMDEGNRGFTFLKDEPLDMRYDKTANELTAAEIVNQWREDEIADILFNYGEERFSRKIAKRIIEERKKQTIVTTYALAEIIKEATPAWYWGKRIHYATKTFQALRIAVNDELGNLEKVLPKAVELLKPGGRLAVISFHSLEDRIAKQFFKKSSQENKITVITKKPSQASLAEKRENPRARSAKLRVVEKI